MITTNGKIFIKRYLAGQVPAIAQCIAFGLGSKPEAVEDTSLQFETSRSEIVLTSYDFVGDKLVFKANLPDTVSGTIYEVALFSQMENPVAGNYSSRLLTSFDSESEIWTNTADNSAGTFTTTGRIGGDSLSVAPAANGSANFALNDILFDLSGNSGADIFTMAYNVGVNVSYVQWRLRTDANNYYSFLVNAPAAGYRIDQFSKGNASVTGTPSWSNITGIEVKVAATAAGAALVEFDGVRIEDTDTINPEYVMISREVLTTPYTKTEGKVQEIEYSLSVNV